MDTLFCLTDQTMWFRQIQGVWAGQHKYQAAFCKEASNRHLGGK